MSNLYRSSLLAGSREIALWFGSNEVTIPTQNRATCSATSGNSGTRRKCWPPRGSRSPLVAEARLQVEIFEDAADDLRLAFPALINSCIVAQRLRSTAFWNPFRPLVFLLEIGFDGGGGGDSLRNVAGFVLQIEDHLVGRLVELVGVNVGSRRRRAWSACPVAAVGCR